MSSIGDSKKTNKPIDVQENKHAGSDVLKQDNDNLSSLSEQTCPALPHDESGLQRSVSLSEASDQQSLTDSYLSFPVPTDNTAFMKGLSIQSRIMSCFIDQCHRDMDEFLCQSSLPADRVNKMRNSNSEWCSSHLQVLDSIFSKINEDSTNLDRISVLNELLSKRMDEHSARYHILIHNDLLDAVPQDEKFQEASFKSSVYRQSTKVESAKIEAEQSVAFNEIQHKAIKYVWDNVNKREINIDSLALAEIRMRIGFSENLWDFLGDKDIHAPNADESGGYGFLNDVMNYINQSYHTTFDLCDITTILGLRDIMLHAPFDMHEQIESLVYTSRAATSDDPNDALVAKRRVFDRLKSSENTVGTGQYINRAIEFGKVILLERFNPGDLGEKQMSKVQQIKLDKATCHYTIEQLLMLSMDPEIEKIMKNYDLHKAYYFNTGFTFKHRAYYFKNGHSLGDRAQFTKVLTADDIDYSRYDVVQFCRYCPTHFNLPEFLLDEADLALAEPNIVDDLKLMNEERSEFKEKAPKILPDTINHYEVFENIKDVQDKQDLQFDHFGNECVDQKQSIKNDEVTPLIVKKKQQNFIDKVFAITRRTKITFDEAVTNFTDLGWAPRQTSGSHLTLAHPDAERSFTIARPHGKKKDNKYLSSTSINCIQHALIVSGLMPTRF